MNAKTAKELLGCTYATLYNYVKSGKLKAEFSGPAKKKYAYDDQSVYTMMDRLHGKKTMHNKVVLFLSNKKYEFQLDKAIVDKVLDLINFELKRESLYDELTQNVTPC